MLAVVGLGVPVLRVIHFLDKDGRLACHQCGTFDRDPILSDIDLCAACKYRPQRLFIQIDADLRGYFISLHNTQERLEREAKRQEAFPYVRRETRFWTRTRNFEEAREIAREMVETEKRRAGYTGSMMDRDRLRNWLIETGRLSEEL
jgi:hypothetical protein